MKIQVLGSGCPTCKKLHQIVLQAVEEINADIEVEYITGETGIQAIIDMGVMSSPVLAVNNKPILTGFVEDVEKIKQLISREASEN